jgi:DNA polymerase IV
VRFTARPLLGDEHRAAVAFMKERAHRVTIAQLMEEPRKILHVDMDAFYASVEQRDDPALRGRPLAVGGSPEGRGVVAAASYEARAYGVRSAMPTARALRLCPELIVVRPDFARYRAVSRQVMAILLAATPLVEPLSLDEAYLDVTRNLWDEPLATEVAKRIRARIRETLGLTASAGVAPNKFLAKIASGWRKPDGLTVIAPERVEAFLHRLPVEALWGVGPVTAQKLRRSGIARLIDVRGADPELLHRTVGNLAGWLQHLSRGVDPRPVQPDRPSKSISAETTYGEDIAGIGAMREAIACLAHRVAASLATKHLHARTVSIKVRYADFTTVTRRHTSAAATRDAGLIASRSLTLLERTEAGRRAVRLLGVCAQGFEGEEERSSGPERLSFDESA